MPVKLVYDTGWQGVSNSVDYDTFRNAAGQGEGPLWGQKAHSCLSDRLA